MNDHVATSPTAMLRGEHEVILRALVLLERLGHALEAGKAVDRRTRRWLVEFFRTFADRMGAPATGTGRSLSGAKTRDLAATAGWDDLLKGKAVICGDPDIVVEELTKAQEVYGFTDLLCWTRLGGLDHRKVLRSMDFMSTKVFPHLAHLEPPPLREAL